jgi:homoserine dehydrogenase
MIKAALLGAGVVGTGVLEVLETNNQAIREKMGAVIEVVYVLEQVDIPAHPYRNLFVYDYNVILEDSEVKVVVEAMGGLNPAYDYTKKALEAGKHVVTSNKELVATHGEELLEIARKNNVNYLFEASVGGGIPIIRPLHQCLSANRISEIRGILNGTTNYVLSQMVDKGQSFEDALADAQAKGYAERDTTADVEGIDAGRKIAILGSMVFGHAISPDDILMEGISKLTRNDVDLAEEWGGTIKLIGLAKELDDKSILCMVSPFVVSNHSLLAHVNDVYNAIMVTGDATGNVMFYGKGAGKLPTASAVVADVMDAVFHRDARRAINWTSADKPFLADHRCLQTRLFIRVVGTVEKQRKLIEEKFGEVEYITRNSEGKAGERGISKKTDDEFAFVTHVNMEGELMDRAKELERAGVEILSVIRVLID